MGFFGGSKTTIPATGYYAQPKAYQNLYSDLLGQAGNLYGGDGSQAAAAFTPQGINAGEQSALDKMYAGFTPTQDSLNTDVNMLMNPFDESVIGSINRESRGQNSLVNQLATQAGQQGSNRSFLGTSDVEQNRLNNIGNFRQSQYNTALSQVLNNLVPNRRADASGALDAGNFERQLDLQTKQAPYSALNAGYNTFNSIPTEFGSFGTPERTVKTGGGLGGLLGTVAPIIGSAFGPVGSVIGGAIGGAASGGGIGGALQGGLGGLTGGMSGLSGLGGQIGNFANSSFFGNLSNTSNLNRYLGATAGL